MATENAENDSFLDENGTSNKKQSKDEEKTKKILKYCVYSLSAFTIVLLIVLLAVTVAWYDVRVKGLKPREHEICLNCSELTSRHEETNVLDQFTRKNGGECCGTTSKILKRLVDKNTKEKYKDDLANNFFASSKEQCKGGDEIPEKPAAKVAGISFMEMKEDASPMNIVHWNETGPNSFFKKSFKKSFKKILYYMEGNIYIAEPGFYYVFNQLKWSLNGTDTTPITHKVNVHSHAKGTYEVLLEGRKSRCSLVEESGETTSSIGAVFELNTADKIFVTTSNPENLVPCHHGNYFGLYLVASKGPTG